MKARVLDICERDESAPASTPAIGEFTDLLDCEGPQRPAGCPVLRGRKCWKLEGVWMMLFRLDLDLEQNRKMLDHYRSANVPIRVETTAAQAARWADILRGVDVFLTDQPRVFGPATPTVPPPRLDRRRREPDAHAEIFLG